MRKFLILFISLASISLSACSEHHGEEKEQPADHLSTLDADKEVVFDVAQAWVDCFGDYYKTGHCMWGIYLQAYDTREQVYIEFLSPVTDANVAAEELTVPTGKYTVTALNKLGAGAILPGILAEENGEILQTYSWYSKLDPSSKIVPVYLEQAPIVEGELTIAEEREGYYNFSFEFKDDAHNRIYGVYAGSAVLEDFRQ